MISIYNSLFFPYINYGIEAWAAAPRGSLNRIVVQQKKAVRAVNCLDYNEHTADYFKSMKLFNVMSLYQFRCSLYLFKILSDHSYNPYFFNYINNISHDHHHLTRNSSQLTLPLLRKSKSQSSFVYSTIKYYNIIPIDIKNSSTIDEFKRRLKEYILNSI